MGCSSTANFILYTCTDIRYDGRTSDAAPPPPSSCIASISFFRCPSLSQREGRATHTALGKKDQWNARSGASYSKAYLYSIFLKQILFFFLSLRYSHTSRTVTENEKTTGTTARQGLPCVLFTLFSTCHFLGHS